jgi:hypothetical protein
MDREVRWDLRREYAEEADGPTAAARRMRSQPALVMDREADIIMVCIKCKRVLFVFPKVQNFK